MSSPHAPHAAGASAATARPELLTVNDVAVRYRTGRDLWGRTRYRDVLHGVSLSIREGETYGLVGESGSGKSTLGRAILRLVPVASGSITFDGQEITAWGSKTPREYRRSVQVVFQNPLTSLNPRMLIEDILAESLAFHSNLTGVELSRGVQQLIDEVGLAAIHGQRYPYELSGGQQQRVAIARALAPRPFLVICDEAVSALDVSTQARVVSLLQDLQRERGLSYLFISHDLGIVQAISHQVGVLRGGRLVEQGPVSEIYRNPQDEYTRELLAASPVMPTAPPGSAAIPTTPRSPQ